MKQYNKSETFSMLKAVPLPVSATLLSELKTKDLANLAISNRFWRREVIREICKRDEAKGQTAVKTIVQHLLDIQPWKKDESESRQWLEILDILINYTDEPETYVNASELYSGLLSKLLSQTDFDNDYLYMAIENRGYMNDC